MGFDTDYLSLSKSGNDIPAAGFAVSGRHAIICGASGSGKTAAAKVILDHDLAAGRHVVIFDPDDVYGDYGRPINAANTMLRYLAAAPRKKGVRFVSDQPDDLINMLKLVFEWAGRETGKRNTPKITVVVDELTVYRQSDRGDARCLEQAASQIANRGRHRGIWGLWVAQKLSQFPEAALHTARLALIGQHKDERDWRAAVRLFTGLDQPSQIANLRLAEFVVWTQGEADIFTLRPPARGGYTSIVNSTRIPALGAGDGETDCYAALADTADEVYAHLARCPAAFDLLADLTGVGEETRAECWQFIEMENARRTTAPHR